VKDDDERENMLCFFLLNLIEDMKLKCGPQSTRIWLTKTAVLFEALDHGGCRSPVLPNSRFSLACPTASRPVARHQGVAIVSGMRYL
jgi:hypothetical protein